MKLLNFFYSFLFFCSIKEKHREENEKNNNFKNISSNNCHALETVQSDVEKFLSSSIEENLNKVEAKVKSLTKLCEEKKIEQSTLDEHIRFLSDQCKSQQAGKEDLENNLDLIKSKEKLKEYEGKLSKYQQSLKDLKFDELKEEFVTLQEEREQLVTEVSFKFH